MLLDQAIREQNDDLLHAWIDLTLGLHIPRNSICPNHCAPFDFIAAAIFARFRQAIARANRSGGKTLGFGIIETVLTFHHDNLEVANVGAIQAQADRCYSYVKDFTAYSPFNSNIDPRNLTATRGTFNNGSLLQMLPGTPTAVNGPHPQLSMLDEVEQMNYAAYQQALSMPQSKGDIPARQIITSTVKYAVGLMIRLIQQYKDAGLPVYEWCIWETVKPLPADNPQLLARIRDTFGDELPANIADADGYYDWEDLIAKKTTLDDEVWSVEWVCNQPERSGLVYPQFSLEANTINPDNPRKQYRKPYVVNAWSPIYILEDAGFGPNNPNVSLFCQMVGDDLIVFDERYDYGKISADILPEQDEVLAEFTREGVPQEAYGILDPAALTETEERKRHGRAMLEPTLDRTFYRLENGIPALRKKIADRSFQVAPQCVNLIGELQAYRFKKNKDGQYTDDSKKKDDHGPDAARYGILRLFPLHAQESIGKQETPRKDKPLAAGMMTRQF